MKSHLENKIKEKASAETQEAIRQFRRECFDAFHKLTLNSLNNGSRSETLSENSVMRTVFEILVSKDFNKGWPKELWEIREKQITLEIVEKMDIVGRVLNCPTPIITETQNVEPVTLP